MADNVYENFTIRVPVPEHLRWQLNEWQRELEEIDRLHGIALRRQLYENWQDRLLRKKAAIASVGFEVGLVEFDWSPGRSVRLEVDQPDYFPVGSTLLMAQPAVEGPCRMVEVFAREGDLLRCVPR